MDEDKRATGSNTAARPTQGLPIKKQRGTPTTNRSLAAVFRADKTKSRSTKRSRCSSLPSGLSNYRDSTTNCRLKSKEQDRPLPERSHRRSRPYKNLAIFPNAKAFSRQNSETP